LAAHAGTQSCQSSSGKDFAIGQFATSMRSYRWLALGAALVAAGLVGSWLTRRPLTEAVIRAYLADKGVAAVYRVVEADDRHLVFADVALGPVGNRDLVARRISVDLVWFGFGPQVAAVQIDAPVLRARILENGISFGSLDRLIPTTKSVRLPAISTVIVDGAAMLATPFGPLTAKIDATGRLDKDFRAAIRTAPTALRSPKCSGDVGAANIIVTTATRDFEVSGAGPVSRIFCASANIASAQWALHLAAPITMASVAANATLSAPAGEAGEMRFAGPSSLRIDGAGTPTQLRGGWRVSIARPAVARETAAVIAGDGRYDWRQAGGLNVGGSLRAAGVASGTVQSALTTAELPDLAAVVAKRLAAAARVFSVDTRFNAVIGGQPRIDVTSADIRGGGGSRLHFSGAPGGRWVAGKTNIDGTIMLSGGGLPPTKLALSGVALGQKGWTGSGRLVVKPWRAGVQAVSVPGIGFRLGDGRADLSGRAIVSTSFATTRVDGLDLRLAVRSSFDGDHVTFGPACADIAIAAVRTTSLVLGRFATRLCPAPGAAAPTLTGKTIRGDIIVGAMKLQGQASGRAFAVDSQPARFTLGGELDRPVVRSPGLMLRSRSGDMTGNAVVAGMVAGSRGGWTGSGHFSEIVADLPSVRIRHGAAKWQLAADRLTIAGISAGVTDPASKPRFSPLQVAEGGVVLTTDRIVAHAAIKLADGLETIATVTGTYLTGSGKGSARLDSTLAFSKTLQPLQISELARGYVANVDGRVVSHADLILDAGGIAGTGKIRFEGLSLATAALGPVTGIDGTLHFDDLPRLHTPPAQQLKIASINPGVLVEDGVVVFQIVDASAIAIETMRWPFTGGTLTLQPVTFRAGEVRRRYVLAVDGLDAGQFLQRFDLKNLNATGRFDGVLPLVFAGNVGRIEGGLLTAHPGGGMIQYVGEVGQDSMGAAARLAFDALRSMRYRALTLALDGDLDGELVTAISFTGTNQVPVKVGGGLPLRSNGLPFKFAITVRAPFRALLGTVASFSDARGLLHKAQSDTAEKPDLTEKPKP